MVNFINCGKNEFLHRALNKKIYCFGAGQYLKTFLAGHDKIVVEGIIDNYRYSTDESVTIDSTSIKIISINKFMEIYSENCIVVITCAAFDEILKQLDNINMFHGLECYISLFMQYYTEYTKISESTMNRKELIPRKIHYCWFGGKEIPKDYQRNIDSWKKYCPDYEIIRWDETNYDVCKNIYIKQAYENKKWAFVTDYARVDILYKHGGIYFDTDVELIKSFDKFLVWRMFCGFESSEFISWGLGFGSVQEEKILKEVLNVYENTTFLLHNGTFNMITCPVIQSEIMKKYCFNMDGQFQVKNEIAVYPKDFFSPFSYIRGLGKITDNTHSIHHYSASWTNKEQQCKRIELQQRVEYILKNRK